MGTGTGSQATWRMLLGYIRPHRWALLAGGLLSLATGATGLALPLAARALVGDLGHHQGAAAVLALMAGLVPGNAGTGAPGSCLLRRTAGSAVPAARRRLADRLLRLRISALDSAGPGDLISRVTGDTTLLREVTTDALTGLVTGSLTLAATLTLMGLPDAVLLAVTLGVFTLAGLVSGLVLPRIRRYARRAQEPAGVMGAALERVLGAFRTIKASGAEWQEGQRVHDAARQAWRADLRAAKLQAVAGNTAALAAQAAFLAVLAAGGARVASGAITVGTLAAFLLYVFYLMSPIQQVVSAISQYQVGACSTPETRPWSVTWDDGVAVLVRLVYRSLATLLSWLALLARSSASENAPPATPASASPTPANTLHTQRRHRALTQPPKAVGPRTS